jgi:hypothetical protein
MKINSFYEFISENKSLKQDYAIHDKTWISNFVKSMFKGYKPSNLDVQLKGKKYVVKLIANKDNFTINFDYGDHREFDGVRHIYVTMLVDNSTVTGRYMDIYDEPKKVAEFLLEAYAEWQMGG